MESPVEDIEMEDSIEEILAEPEESGGFLASVSSLLETTGGIILTNGWFILGGGLAAYYIWKKYGTPTFLRQTTSGKPVLKTTKELQDFQLKEEQRLRALQRLQEKYDKEATERAAELQALEEEKKKARLAELERLNPNPTSSRHTLGTADSGSPTLKSSTTNAKSNKPAKKPSTPSFRPEYNPLMGDTTSRVCFRPSTGRSGG